MFYHTHTPSPSTHNSKREQVRRGPCCTFEYFIRQFSWSLNVVARSTQHGCDTHTALLCPTLSFPVFCYLPHLLHLVKYIKCVTNPWPITAQTDAFGVRCRQEQKRKTLRSFSPPPHSSGSQVDSPLYFFPEGIRTNFPSPLAKWDSQSGFFYIYFPLCPFSLFFPSSYNPFFIVLLNTRTCVQMPSSENEKKAKSRFEEEEKTMSVLIYFPTLLHSKTSGLLIRQACSINPRSFWSWEQSRNLVAQHSYFSIRFTSVQCSHIQSRSTVSLMRGYQTSESWTLHWGSPNWVLVKHSHRSFASAARSSQIQTKKKADKYQKEEKIREKSEPIVPGNLYTSKTLWRKQTRLKSFRSKPVGWGLECFDFKSQESPKPFQRCERDFTKSVSSYFEFSTSSSFE